MEDTIIVGITVADTETVLLNPNKLNLDPDRNPNLVLAFRRLIMEIYAEKVKRTVCLV